MPPVVLVAVGGVAGALARAGVGEALPHAPGTWAWSTLAVNATGAAALVALLATSASASLRLLVGTGLLGGFTTFSTFAVDAVLLAESGRAVAAAAYVLVGVATLLAGGGVGLLAARAVGGKA